MIIFSLDRKLVLSFETSVVVLSANCVNIQISFF